MKTMFSVYVTVRGDNWTSQKVAVAAHKEISDAASARRLPCLCADSWFVVSTFLSMLGTHLGALVARAASNIAPRLDWPRLVRLIHTHAFSMTCIRRTRLCQLRVC